MVAAINPASLATVNSALSTSDGLSLEAPTKELASALALFARVADRKSMMPILAHVALRVTADTTLICATDLNISLTMSAPAWRVSRGGFAVPCKQLMEIVKAAPGSDVRLTHTSATGLRIVSGGLDTALRGVPDRDFPKLPSSDGLTFEPVNGKEFAAMLDRTAHSVCMDETRFHLAGVFVERWGLKSLRAVSTDGHRLALVNAPNVGGDSLPTKGVIIPERAATAIVRLIKANKGAPVQIAHKAPHVFVRVAGYELAVKTIDAQFPAYSQVIPKDNRKLATVDRKLLIAALRRTKPLCCSTRGVKISLHGDTLTLTAEHPDLGTAVETLVAETVSDTTIGVNASYLLDAVTEIDDERVTIAFGANPLDPILVRGTTTATSEPIMGSDFLAVVMPMRI